jgi:nitronate monooxygenase
VFDIVRGYDWPGSFTGRSLRNGFTDRWHGSEAQLAAALDSERPAYFAAAAADNTDIGVVWAGEGIDLIDSIEDAAMLTERLGREAETHLRRRFELLELKN